MSFKFESLLFASVVYLLMLFLIARATDKRWTPSRVVRHPATYVLSLGVYASSWAYFGNVAIAKDNGYLFLALSFGVSGAFLLAPVLLTPILKITRTSLHNLGTVAFVGVSQLFPGALRVLYWLRANDKGFLAGLSAGGLIWFFKNKDYVAQDIHFMGSRLESYHSRLTGLAAELDALRRDHRDTLDKLPLALFSVDANGKVMLWNQAMAKMTDIEPEKIMGLSISSLKPPWNELLSQFTTLDSLHLHKHCLEVNGVPRYFSLHKALKDVSTSSSQGNQVMLLEDRTANQMLENQLLHSERLASIGQLAAGVAHEIGNPVTGIDCLAQELRACSKDVEVRNIAGQVLDQTQRITRIVRTLASYAHNGQLYDQQGQANEVSLHHCAEESISLLKLSNKPDSIEFINHCQLKHKVVGDQQKLQQALTNLLSNAVDASGDNSRIIITTSANARTVTLLVEDQGQGIPESIQGRLFEPFFTTKEAGKGTGLGLALAWNIIEEHSGTIKVKSPINKELGTGARFIITLPRCKAGNKEGEQSHQQNEAVI